MRNKSLRQNWKIMAKIKLAPINIDEPVGLSHINEWAEKVWSHLCDDELTRHSCHILKGKKGFNITVWSDDKYCYLVQCVRTEYNTDEILIYMNELTEDNLNDFKSIAKMIRYNIKDIIGHSLQGVHELNKYALAKEIADGQA